MCVLIRRVLTYVCPHFMVSLFLLIPLRFPFSFIFPFIFLIPIPHLLSLLLHLFFPLPILLLFFNGLQMYYDTHDSIRGLGIATLQDFLHTYTQQNRLSLGSLGDGNWRRERPQ